MILTHYAKLTFLFLAMSILSIVSVANSTNPAIDYELEGKTLYINNDDTLLTDSILDAFRKYWTITKIEFQDSEEYFENFKNDNALILSILKETSYSGAYRYEKSFLTIVIGNKSAKKSEDYKKFTAKNDPIQYRNYILSMNKEEKVTRLEDVNIDVKAAFIVRGLQTDILTSFGKIEKINYAKYKTFTLAIPIEEIRTKDLYINKKAVDRRFEYDTFCAIHGLDPAKVKMVSKEEIDEIINTTDDVLVSFGGNYNNISFYFNKTGNYGGALVFKNKAIVGNILMYTGAIIIIGGIISLLAIAG